jgi:hypothetical protein
VRMSRRSGANATRSSSKEIYGRFVACARGAFDFYDAFLSGRRPGQKTEREKTERKKSREKIPIRAVRTGKGGKACKRDG